MTKLVRLLIAGLCFFVLHSNAQQTAQKFIQETNYLLSLPDGYNEDTLKRWPLLIFLHGSGESGNDLAKVKAYGPPRLADQGKKFPFIIVSPQAPPFVGWETEDLYQLLLHIKKTQRVDEERIYLTGLSMGGFGIWALAMKHPEEFAAIAPVCGGGDSTEAWKLRNMGIWCFHGAKDDVVLPIQSEKMVKAARRFNPSVRYTLYPNANHNSWDLTYNSDTLYQWLLTQKKFMYTEVPVSESILKQYAGKYVSPEKDTLIITAGKEGLTGKINKETFPLKAAGENLFFFQPNEAVDVRFVRNKGIVTSLLVLARQKTVFTKQ